MLSAVCHMSNFPQGIRYDDVPFCFIFGSWKFARRIPNIPNGRKWYGVFAPENVWIYLPVLTKVCFSTASFSTISMHVLSCEMKYARSGGESVYNGHGFFFVLFTLPFSKPLFSCATDYWFREKSTSRTYLFLPYSTVCRWKETITLNRAVNVRHGWCVC